jgi:ABC-type molybdenum transport system ATPase subunit/photorepair protein PhrA
LIPLRSALDVMARHLTATETAAATLARTTETCAQEEALLTEVDAILRALLQQKTTESFAEVETLLLRGLQTVFGPAWQRVTMVCMHKNNRLHAELSLTFGEIEGPVLDTFGGGPAALVSFLLRVLVLRRTGLAPVLLLDETFSQVSEDYLTPLSTFLRLLADRLGMTILLVTHQPKFAHAANRVYTTRLMPGNKTLLTEVTDQYVGA